MFDFADYKAQSRRIVHDTLAASALYLDEKLAAPVALRVRWHYKQAPIGDLEATGYAVVIDLIEKVIFDKEELATKGVQIEQGGRLQITAPGFEAVLAIDTQEDSQGPVNEVWRVGKLKNGELAP